jgi:Protein of unknown function (DUF1353)
MRRRHVLALHAAFGAGMMKGVLAQSQDIPADAQSDTLAATEWMDAWYLAGRAPIGGLHLFRFADRTYALSKEIGWAPSEQQSGLPSISVPFGFVTDLASIPRMFWTIFPPDGDYTFPAIVHDFLYWTQPISRESADKIFMLGMEEFNIPAATRDAIYSGVRLGGRSAWNANAQRRARGEKKILKRLPNDPLTTFAEFSRLPDVFAD